MQFGVMDGSHPTKFLTQMYFRWVNRFMINRFHRMNNRFHRMNKLHCSAQGPMHLLSPTFSSQNYVYHRTCLSTCKLYVCTICIWCFNNQLGSWTEWEQLHPMLPLLHQEMNLAWKKLGSRRTSNSFVDRHGLNSNPKS